MIYLKRGIALLLMFTLIVFYFPRGVFAEDNAGDSESLQRSYNLLWVQDLKWHPEKKSEFITESFAQNTGDRLVTAPEKTTTPIKPKKKSKWWMYLLLVGVVAGIAAAAGGGGGSSGSGGGGGGVSGPPPPPP